RLTPGAKADVIVVDLLQPHYGAVHDPIKSLVECGTGRDVETVIVDAQVLIDGGKPARVDEPTLLAAVQAEGERLWRAIPEWHWSGKTLDDVVSPSYPVQGGRRQGLGGASATMCGMTSAVKRSIDAAASASPMLPNISRQTKYVHPLAAIWRSISSRTRPGVPAMAMPRWRASSKSRAKRMGMEPKSRQSLVRFAYQTA